jgi:hypothetical protein
MRRAALLRNRSDATAGLRIATVIFVDRAQIPAIALQDPVARLRTIAVSGIISGNSVAFEAQE